ncbi:MAG: ROK family protein [Mariniphaga sp.]
MRNDKIAIGVDIGGTNVRAGAVSNDGGLIGESFSVSTNATERKELILSRIVDSISRIITQNKLSISDIQGIGLGCTGPLDVKKGLILECPNLPTMDYFPLRSEIEKAFNLPVFMNNDANAMMLGEATWGAGRGASSILGITLGTGFGCAIILNQKIWMGATETAGEIWISPYGDGYIEEVVSGAGVCKLYEKLSGLKASSKQIAHLANEGDQFAKAVWEEFGKAVAFALSWSINLLDPEIVIIGGSISNAFELFYPSLYESLVKTICPVPAQNLKIVKAQLGDNAGFIGAAALVF